MIGVLAYASSLVESGMDSRLRLRTMCATLTAVRYVGENAQLHCLDLNEMIVHGCMRSDASILCCPSAAVDDGFGQEVESW
jgi:hypothetical protein